LIDGFVPIVGPGCSTGYLAEAVGPVESKSTGLPVGVEEVRAEPSRSAEVVGYVIPGRVGWIAAGHITASGFSFADLVVASEAIQAERERARASFVQR
jgi:hypothetical protein